MDSFSCADSYVHKGVTDDVRTAHHISAFNYCTSWFVELPLTKNLVNKFVHLEVNLLVSSTDAGWLCTV